MEQASEGNILIYQAEDVSAMLDSHHPLRADLPAAATLRRRPADRAARATRGGMLPTPEEARAPMARLKANLIVRGEATELRPFAALLGNLDQTVFREPASPNIKARATHLP